MAGASAGKSSADGPKRCGECQASCRLELVTTFVCSSPACGGWPRLRSSPDWWRVCHGVHSGEGPVLAMFATPTSAVCSATKIFSGRIGGLPDAMLRFF